MTETSVVSSGEPKKTNTWLIVGIIAVVVLCCLCVFFGAAAWYLYTNGDEIFGLSALPGMLGVV
jgi:uncharacterized membrane protein